MAAVVDTVVAVVDTVVAGIVADAENFETVVADADMTDAVVAFAAAVVVAAADNYVAGAVLVDVFDKDAMKIAQAVTAAALARCLLCYYWPPHTWPTLFESFYY